MLRRTGPKQYEPSEHPLTVLGSEAKAEGTFDIADSIQIECEVGGRMKVGGSLVIGERGFVHADVEAVDVIIHGQYNGNMVATGSVEVAPTGRVVGNIETNSLVISKGGFFNGTTVKLKESQVEGGPPPADQPKQGEVAAEGNERKISILRETDLDHAIHEHGLASLEDEVVPSGQADGRADSESEDLLGGPPEPLGRTQPVPRSERRKKTKIGDYYHASVAKLKEPEAEEEPVPDFLIEDMGEPLPPLLSQDELLPADPDPDEGPPPGVRSRRKGRRAQGKQGSGSAPRGADVGHAEEDHGLSPDEGGEVAGGADGRGDSKPYEPPKRRGRARAVPRAGRRKKTETSHDHDPPVKLEEKHSKAEEGQVPAFLVHDMGDTLPPLPSRAELLPADPDPDEGPQPEWRPGWDEPGDGMNQRSGSVLPGDDDPGDNRGTSRVSWGSPPAPFPDDDPLGIR